jgi:3-oxoacyl-[acyl-carrier-protein] synthase-3
MLDDTPQFNNDTLVQQTLRRLTVVWTDFEGRLERVPIIEKINRRTLTLEDYQAFLKNLRQQVIDGGCWIARAASHVSVDHFSLRSTFMRHAVTEHRDFQMLEANYVESGGRLEDIQTGEKNIGSEALSAFMFHRASQPDPFDLLGAMFMIEGLGSRKAREWGLMIQEQLELRDEQISFLLYHGEHDDDHLAEFETWLKMVVDSEAVSNRIVKTAQIVARLYALQLEEIVHD